MTRTRRLGDRDVFPIGLGCMPLSSKRMLDHRERALMTIHAALDAGVDLLDTADVYAPDAARVGHNELLVAEALRSYTGARRPLVATKGGLIRNDTAVWGRSAGADALLAAAEASATRLGVSTIDLYYLHRADPVIPYGEQIAALAALKQRRLVSAIAVSNVDAPMLRRALDVAGGPADGGIVAVQNERSPRYRADADVLDICTQTGIAYLPWSPLTGSEAFAVHAAERGVSPQRLALAWLLAESPVVIPIPGSSRPATILDSIAAADMSMSVSEVEALSAIPASGESLYPDHLPKPAL